MGNKGRENTPVRPAKSGAGGPMVGRLARIQAIRKTREEEAERRKRKTPRGRGAALGVRRR
jgi:hypothetical protein